jgi:hypothetical protein
MEDCEFAIKWNDKPGFCVLFAEKTDKLAQFQFTVSHPQPQEQEQIQQHGSPKDDAGIIENQPLVVEKSLLVAMTDAERSKLLKVLAQHKYDVVVDETSIENGNQTITVENLRCVQGENWLNSEIINMYVKMIEVAALTAGYNVMSFNSFFLGKIIKEVNIGRLHLTPHTSHLTPHTSHLTPHTSHLTPHTSHLTPHTSHLTSYRVLKRSKLGPINSKQGERICLN